MNAPQTTKVFVSYSRKDRAQVDKLVNALEAEEGIDVFRDTDDILPTEEWKTRLADLIAQADTVVFALSPDSVKSDVCRWEAEHAESLNKRIAPIVIRSMSGASIPENLARLNHIFFTNARDFEKSLRNLVVSLSTDIGWIREHTRLGELARRWDDRKRPASQSLTGQDLADAENWLALQPAKAPAPTALHIDYIQSSRRLATRRQRMWIAASLMFAVFALVLSAFAWTQKQQAEVQRAVAEHQQQIAARERDVARETQSRLMTGKGLDLAEDGETDAALQIIVEALQGRGYDGAPPFVPEAERALFKVLGMHRLLRTFRFDGRRIVHASLDAEGKRAMLVLDDGTAQMHAVDTGERIAAPALEHAGGAVTSAVFSSAGNRIAVVTDRNLLHLLDNDAKNEVAQLQFTAPIEEIIFRPQGDRMVISSIDDNGSRRVVLADAITGATVRDLTDVAKMVAVSGNGSIVACARDAKISVVDFASGEIKRTISDQNEGPLSASYLSVNADGTLISSGDYDGVRLFDAATGKQTIRVRTHQYRTFSMQFSPVPNDLGDIFVTSGDDGTLVWGLIEGAATSFAREDGERHFLPGGYLVPTAVDDGDPDPTNDVDEKLPVWALPVMPRGGFDAVTVATVHGRDLVAAARAPRVAVIRANGSVQVVALGTPYIVAERRWTEDDNQPDLIAVSPDGNTVAGAAAYRDVPGDIALYDPATLEETARFVVSKAPHDALTVENGGKRTAFRSEDGSAYLIDRRSHPVKVTEVAARRKPSAIQFVGGAALAAVADEDGTISIINVESGASTATVHGVPTFVNAPWLSPDGGIVLVATKEEVYAAPAQDGAVMQRLPQPAVCADAFKPAWGRKDDGTPNWLIAAGGDVIAISGDRAYWIVSWPDRSILSVNGSVCDDNEQADYIAAHGSQVYVANANQLIAVDGRSRTRMEPRELVFQDGISALDWRDEVTGIAGMTGGVGILVNYSHGMRIVRAEGSLQQMLTRAREAVLQCLTPTERNQFGLDPAPPDWCVERRAWPYGSQRWTDWLEARRAGREIPLPAVSK